MLKASYHAVAGPSRSALVAPSTATLDFGFSRAFGLTTKCAVCAAKQVYGQPGNAPAASRVSARTFQTSTAQAREARKRNQRASTGSDRSASSFDWQQHRNHKAPGSRLRDSFRPSTPSALLAAKTSQPPSLGLIREALFAEINAFPESLRVSGRLATIGIKGDAIRALLLDSDALISLCDDTFARLQSTGSSERPSSPHFNDLVSTALVSEFGEDDIPVLQRLLQEWRRAAMRSLQSASAFQQTKERDQSVPKRQAMANLPFSMEFLRQAYEVEGIDAVKRACMHHFLDWIKLRAEHLIETCSRSAGVDSGGDHTAESILHPIRHSASILLSTLNKLSGITDYMLPASQYSSARSLRRQIHLHIGPTNSGKTYGALLALTKAESGVYAGPLRLLAHEVYERINEGTIGNVPPRPCNLLTGEERRIVDEDAGLVSCTVEMVEMERIVDVAVIDEIQMIGDPGRGNAWTAAVLGLPARELHLCGEASALPLIRRLVALCHDDLHIHTYQRLTPLRIAEKSLGGDLSKIEKGDCIVTFARSNIFFLKRVIEQRTGLRCAVAYGALPPETRSEQARRFNDTSENGLDVMVASDAIGMGLNLKIKRIIFETCSKWDGNEQLPLSTSQIKQIAGRAGRYGTQDQSDGSEPAGGVVTTLHEDDMPFIHAALASNIVPIRRAGLFVRTSHIFEGSALIASTNELDRSLGIDIWSNADPAEEEENGDQDEMPKRRGKKGRRSKGDDDAELDHEGGEDGGASDTHRGRRSKRDEDSKRKGREADEAKPMSLTKQKVDAIMKVIQPNSLSNPTNRPPWYDSSSSLTTLYSFVKQLVRFDPTLFFLPNYDHEHDVSPIVEACARGQLTVGEKEQIGKAPTQLRDERVVLFLSSIIRSLGRGDLVKFDECAKGLGMLEVLDEVEQAVAEKSAASNPASESTPPPNDVNAAKTEAASEDASNPSASKLSPLNDIVLTADGAHPVLNLGTLLVLESLHRSITLFLWMSFRFVLPFAAESETSRLKLRTERAIEHVLAATRFQMRNRRPKITKNPESRPSVDVTLKSGAALRRE